MFYKIVLIVFRLRIIRSGLLTQHNPRSPIYFSIATKLLLHCLFSRAALCQQTNTSEPTPSNGTVHLPRFNNPQRIIGGVRAEPGEFPYAVSIQDNWMGRHLCGGTLINASKVLTACHCLVLAAYSSGVYVKPASYLSLQAGTNVIGSWSNRGQRRNAEYLSVHPNCGKDGAAWKYDFGLMFTDEPFRIVPKCLEILPETSLLKISVDNFIQKHTPCVSIGWGYVSEDSAPVDHLMKVDLFLVDDNLCHKLMERAATAYPNFDLEYKKEFQLCTLGDGGKDACQGDSGGPLFCQNILVGTVSWGIGCGRIFNPGIWGRIEAAYDWIKNHNRGSEIGADSRFKAIMILSIFQLHSLLAN